MQFFVSNVFSKTDGLALLDEAAGYVCLHVAVIGWIGVGSRKQIGLQNTTGVVHSTLTIGVAKKHVLFFPSKKQLFATEK